MQCQDLTTGALFEFNSLLGETVCPVGSVTPKEYDAVHSGIQTFQKRYVRPEVITQPNVYNTAYYPAVLPQTAITTTGFSLIDWVKAHPYIVLGGAAILAYFIFFGGLGKSNRVRTDITKWGS
jgi:hypothetical protein